MIKVDFCHIVLTTVSFIISSSVQSLLVPFYSFLKAAIYCSRFYMDITTKMLHLIFIHAKFSFDGALLPHANTSIVS